MFSVAGKVAVVTGASRGLGQTFARALAKAGADLVITSRPLVAEVLRAVEPYVVFKRQHVKVALRMLSEIQPPATPEDSIRNTGPGFTSERSKCKPCALA